jgi:hypothetical protein
MLDDVKVYIVDRIEHGNCGVCGCKVLDELLLLDALKKKPYDYGVCSKEWDFWPVISFDEEGDNVLYYWDDDNKWWFLDK